MTDGQKQQLQAHRPLTEAERTETLLTSADMDITRWCGCTFWRVEDGVNDDEFMATWCERHLPLYLYDEAGVQCA